MNVIYTILIAFYTIAIHVAALFNRKAAKWVKGRKGWRSGYRDLLNDRKNLIWIHCASLGEFEQGRPLIEMFKKKDPATGIIVTFFSPSGFEVMKDWKGADNILYLPADLKSNAEDFLDIVRPSMVIFIKYEFWNNYISAIYKRGIPLYLVSALFRPGQYFFSWYGAFFRKQLKKYTRIFVQDNTSRNLLLSAGITEVVVSGDTRFDRVARISESAKSIPVLEKFRGKEKLFIAGSSWQPDEEIIAEYINENPSRMKWVFAPHEIHDSNIDRIESLFRTKCVRYSDSKADLENARVLIIDNIGLLSSAYGYAAIAEVGGGFGKGIHNTLEPAAWGIPVLFGPDHEKYREAVELIAEGGAFSFRTREQFFAIMDRLLSDEKLLLEASGKAAGYVKKNTGVTHRIIEGIREPG